MNVEDFVGERCGAYEADVVHECGGLFGGNVRRI